MSKVLSLTKEELQEIQNRKSLIRGKQIEVNLLSREMNMYTAALFSKYKLDDKKNYEITPEGEIVIPKKKEGK